MCDCSAGLDSFAALSVMGYLQDITAANKQTLVATIHQPRDAIWEMFDTVIKLPLQVAPSASAAAAGLHCCSPLANCQRVQLLSK